MSNISDQLRKTLKILNSQNLANVAYTQFVRTTPVKSGNARKNTILNNTEIKMNYPYGQVLDQGRGFRDGQMRGSEQAPQGMSKPTFEYLRQYIYSKTGIKLKG